VTRAAPGPSGPVPVVCAIVERKGRVLACRRNPRQTNAGLWEFPGGKVRKGEPRRAALVREIREELGIEAAPQKPLTPVTHAYPWIAIKLIPFVCSLEQGEPHPHEHAEVRWVDKKEAMKLDWAEADVPIVREYYKKMVTKTGSAVHGSTVGRT
jgi:8-oxo-dGTP diphosphatase